MRRGPALVRWSKLTLGLFCVGVPVTYLTYRWGIALVTADGANVTLFFFALGFGFLTFLGLVLSIVLAFVARVRFSERVPWVLPEIALFLLISWFLLYTWFSNGY